MATTTATQTERIVLGNLTAKELKNGKVIEGAICLDHLNTEQVQDLIYEIEGKRYLNIKIVQRKKPSDWGRTHFIQVDQFVPNKKG
jgi:hypothetical protein